MSIVGGLVSSASTAGAAATLSMHGTISPETAGIATILTSVTSALSRSPHDSSAGTKLEADAQTYDYLWNRSRCWADRNGLPKVAMSFLESQEGISGFTPLPGSARFFLKNYYMRRIFLYFRMNEAKPI